jgi:hypothetical protein
MLMDSKVNHGFEGDNEMTKTIRHPVSGYGHDITTDYRHPRSESFFRLLRREDGDGAGSKDNRVKLDIETAGEILPNHAWYKGMD